MLRIRRVIHRCRQHSSFISEGGVIDRTSESVYIGKSNIISTESFSDISFVIGAGNVIGVQFAFSSSTSPCCAQHSCTYHFGVYRMSVARWWKPLLWKTESTCLRPVWVQNGCSSTARPATAWTVLWCYRGTHTPGSGRPAQTCRRGRSSVRIGCCKWFRCSWVPATIPLRRWDRLMYFRLTSTNRWGNRRVVPTAIECS